MLPNPYTEEVSEQCMEQVFRPTSGSYGSLREGLKELPLLGLVTQRMDQGHAKVGGDPETQSGASLLGTF